MSGTNSLINSIITKKGGSNKELTSALSDANTFVVKTEGEKKEKKENKKK